jgi:hypothetical protein
VSELSSQSMPRRLPTGCIEDRDRHGNVRIYYRAKGGPKVRLRGTPWTPEFMAEYEGAKGEAPAAKAKGITPGTWRWLCTRYFAECADYLRLEGRTKRVRRGIIEATFDEPIAPGSPRFFREGANNRVKAATFQFPGTASFRSRRTSISFAVILRSGRCSNGPSERKARTASRSPRTISRVTFHISRATTRTTLGLWTKYVAHQLMAMFGWRTLKMAEQYTRAADQQRLAEAAMHMLDPREQTRTESCPTEAPGGTFSAKTEAKSKGDFGGGAQERTRTSTPRGAST